MASSQAGVISELVEQARSGRGPSVEEVVPLVYAELRRIASSYLRRERPGHTLQPTALVNEACLRLLKARELSFEDRAHFLGLAAHSMRQILVEHARGRGAAKRGGSRQRITLDERQASVEAPAIDLLALDEALDRLATSAPQLGRIVELRFFGGLTNEETAAALGVSEATVKRAWAVARAWLYRELTGR